MNGILRVLLMIFDAIINIAGVYWLTSWIIKKIGFIRGINDNQIVCPACHGEGKVDDGAGRWIPRATRFDD
jgi:hypothetical protein